jgi:hypothetical protein
VAAEVDAALVLDVVVVVLVSSSPQAAMPANETKRPKEIVRFSMSTSLPSASLRAPGRNPA